MREHCRTLIYTTDVQVEHVIRVVNLLGSGSTRFAPIIPKAGVCSIQYCWITGFTARFLSRIFNLKQYEVKDFIFLGLAAPLFHNIFTTRFIHVK